MLDLSLQTGEYIFLVLKRQFGCFECRTDVSSVIQGSHVIKDEIISPIFFAQNLGHEKYIRLFGFRLVNHLIHVVAFIDRGLCICM